MGKEINRGGFVDLSQKFNTPKMSRKSVKDFFFKENVYRDKYGIKQYTYIPTGAGLDEEGLKLEMIDAYETSSAEIWKKKMEFASRIVTTDRYFERIPIHFGTQAPPRFKGDRVYHDIRFNAQKVIAVEYSDGYTWKLRDEMTLQIQNAIAEIATSHIADYASIPARQFSYLLQATANDDYYPEPVYSAFDDAALINGVSGRLMAAAQEAQVGTFAGNTLTGTMSTTPAIATLSADFDALLLAGSLMEHPTQEGDKFWENVYDPRMKYICYVPPALLPLFRDLVKLESYPTAGTSGSPSGSTRNIFFQSTQIEVKTLPHLVGSTSDYSWFMQIYDPTQASRVPFIEVDPERQEVPEIETWGWDTGNKEMSDTLSKAVGYYKLKGYGCGLPQTMMKCLCT